MDWTSDQPGYQWDNRQTVNRLQSHLPYTIIPHGETIFLIVDVVEVYGMEADIEVARNLLGAE
jgi:hypothetical protein